MNFNSVKSFISCEISREIVGRNVEDITQLGVSAKL